VTLFFGIKVAFFRKRQDRSVPIFFSGFRRKHLFITTCIEKQCIRPLREYNQDLIFLFVSHSWCHT